MEEQLIEIADLCYQDRMEEGKARVQLVIPELTLRASELSVPEQEQYINKALMPMLSAMEGTDSVYLADVIYYELLPFFVMESDITGTYEGEQP